jgi:hypothetical protein
MIRRTKNACSAILLATSLTAASAMAQAPQASPVAQDKAGAPAKKGSENGEKGKPEKQGEKGERHRDDDRSDKHREHDKDDRAKKDDDRKNDLGAKTDDKGGEPGSVGAAMRRGPDGMPKERLERWKNQQDLERTKIKAALRGRAMDQAMKQELEHHARRIARLERIKAVAVEAKDTATIERVNKLIELENARHDRVTSHFDSKDDKGSKDEKAPKEKDDKGSKDDKAPKEKDDKGSKDEKGGAK